MNKIKFHYTYYIISISFLITGSFLNLLIFTSLIIIHELGHYLACLLTKVNVNKIVIYPYGGITKIDDIIDIDFSKELLISISGIVIQSLYFFIVYLLYNNYLIRDYTYNIFCNYHYSMLIFNLIPIYPLDGSKILNIIINKLFNFKLSNILLIIISIINMVVMSFIYNLNYSYIMIIGVLVNYLYSYIKIINYLYNRFLLVKYLYKTKYNNKKIINNYNKMYRNTNHIIRKDNKYLKEDDFLLKMFDLK